MIEEVTGLSCPRCSHEGPHQRLGTTQDGARVATRCGDNLCALEWTVTG